MLDATLDRPMTLKKADHPFRFSTQLNLIELTGRRARTLAELLDYLKQAATSVIYHHTHHFLKQHQFLSPEPTNDFAYWVTNVLQEDRLGERLAAIDTIQFHSVKALGDKIIKVMDDYMKERGSTRVAPEGEEFHFMKSRGFVLSTPYVANDLIEFRECVNKISVRSLYHHIFDARIRLEKGVNDFSRWLENEMDEKVLAHSIARLDPYTQTLEGLRHKIIRLLDMRIAYLSQGGEHASR